MQRNGAPRVRYRQYQPGRDETLILTRNAHGLAGARNYLASKHVRWQVSILDAVTAGLISFAPVLPGSSIPVLKLQFHTAPTLTVIFDDDPRATSGPGSFRGAQQLVERWSRATLLDAVNDEADEDVYGDLVTATKETKRVLVIKSCPANLASWQPIVEAAPATHLVLV
jgi:hypothetical protein